MGSGCTKLAVLKCVCAPTPAPPPAPPTALQEKRESVLFQFEEQEEAVRPVLEIFQQEEVMDHIQSGRCVCVCVWVGGGWGCVLHVRIGLHTE